MTVGVIGLGFVGSNLKRYFDEFGDGAIGYDPKVEGSFLETVKQDVLFLCLPTPYRDGLKKYDLSILEETVQKIADLAQEKIVIIKSTILPGTTQDLQYKYQHLKIGFVPEFLTERTAWEDTVHPDTSIFGFTKQSHTIAQDILDLLPDAPFQRVMRSEEAEMVKMARNNYFVNKIVFCNALYDICQANALDYDTVKNALASDRRIRRSHMDIFHQSGRGGGGKCFPKDSSAFRDYVQETTGGDAQAFVDAYVNLNMKLLNDSKKDKGTQFYE